MSPLRKAGYQETTIGWIPADWKAEQLGVLSDIDSESLSNKTPEDFSFLYISLSDVDSGKLINSITPIAFADAPSRARRVVKSGDILFATVRPNLKGHYFARKVHGNVIASTGFAVVRAKQEVVDPRFLYQTLLSSNVDEQIEKLTVGSNYPAVNSADVKGLRIALPPLSEQKKIAAILTAMDDKLDLIGRQIEATKTLKQGLTQKLFRQKGNAAANVRWPTVSLHEVAEVRTGVAKGKKGLKKPVTFPYLRVANVQDGRVDLSEIKTIDVEAAQVERYALRAGDVLMTEGGDFDKLGRGDVWKAQISPCLHQNHVFAVRPDAKRLNPYYLAALAASDHGRQYFLSCAKRTTNLASINSTQLKAFPVLLPSLDEQAHIADVMSAVSAKIGVLEAKQRQHYAIKRGLMQKLLTGEWRLNLHTPAEALAA
jgi:type I restriction enzyme S subunit